MFRDYMAKVTVHMLNKHGRDAENKEDPFRGGVFKTHQNESFLFVNLYTFLFNE